MSEASELKERAALASIAASAILTIGKFAAGIASGSLAILSEAGHNLADVAATILTYFAIRIANKPADEDHHYGHGKVEALAALIETGFLFGLSVYILVEAFRRLFSEDVEIEANWLAFGVLIISIVIDIARWRSLRRVALTTRSEALAADALHFSSDIVSSALALGGLVAAHYGYPQGDAIAALGVAVFVAIAGYRIGRRTVDALTDAAPKGLAEEITSIARAVPGVIDIETARLRPAGGEVIGDLSISVARTLPLEKAAAIKANVAAAIAARRPEVALTVTTHPIALDDETILERVFLIAAKRHVQIHHVTLQEIDGKTSISFDVEIDGRMTHGNAHEIVSGLERQIRHELGYDVEVETHVEPQEPRQLPGRDASAAAHAEIASALARIAPQTGAIEDVHSVRVRETPAGLVVNYHCRVDPELSVDAVHECVDVLERKMRDEFASIIRIVGHAEPLLA
ncbi:cation diffusion facilitator family transporter [Methylocapsa acidiphila]|uniref:cation diffusion facilitator family transporter n=1 Tax=Methylocapsa acidiphila TaxID=133552 RepID=UPI00040669CA|nr:cation diffusion facilitator family transporter [Methylocapsa acidiphila]